MRRMISVLALFTGLFVTLVGLLAGVGFLVRQASSGPALLQNETLLVSLILLALAFGLPLIWAGLRSIQDRPVTGFRLPGWGWLLLLLLGVLITGQALFSADQTSLLPLFHVLAGLLPGLTFLSIAVSAARKRGRVVPARAAWGSLSWGGLGGPGIAMAIELLSFFVIAAMAAVFLQATRPELVQQLQDWAMDQMARGNAEPNLAPLIPMLASPVVVGGILIIMGLVAPLAEEFSKTLAIPIVAVTGYHLRRVDGFLLGAAAGAGFSMLESSLYGLMGLSMPAAWGAVMLVRGSTAAIHCLASALAGLGWQAVLAERRWGRGFGLGLLAVILHGTWNVAATGQALASLQGLTGANIAEPDTMARMLIIMFAVGFMGLIWIVTVGALPLVSVRAANESALVSDWERTGTGAETPPIVPAIEDTELEVEDVHTGNNPDEPIVVSEEE